MKIIYISKGNIPSKYAHTFQAMKMAEAFCSQVDQVTLLTARGIRRCPDESVDLHRWYGTQPLFRVARLPVFWRLPQFVTHADTRNYARATALYARMRSPDLVYTRSFRVARYCVTLGLKTVLESHGNAFAGAARMRDVRHSKHFLGLVTVNDYLKSQHVDQGFSGSRILVWPDAVDAKRFANLPTKTEARELLGLPTHKPLVTYCGHFYEEKGVPCLVDAARLLPNVTFCLVGGWPDDIQKMRERAAGLDNISFAGFVPNQDVPNYLSAADILVVPNSARFEHAQAASPLKLFEYMAASRPIVATDVPALREYVTHEENSILVAPDSASSLADGIRAVLKDSGMAKRLAESALERVKLYTWERRAKDILNYFGFGEQTVPQLPREDSREKAAA